MNAFGVAAFLGVTSLFLGVSESMREGEEAMATLQKIYEEDELLMQECPEYRRQFEAFMADPAPWRLKGLLAAKEMAMTEVPEIPAPVYWNDSNEVDNVVEPERAPQHWPSNYIVVQRDALQRDVPRPLTLERTILREPSNTVLKISIGIAVILFILFLVSGAKAQSCTVGTNVVESLNCFRHQEAVWDQRMNFAYAGAILENPTGVVSLQRSQNAWLEYREQRCIHKGSDYGRVSNIFIYNCRVEMTKARTCDLIEDSEGPDSPMLDCSKIEDFYRRN